jgi:RNA polymerase sigma factor (sigma-70 family)
LKAWLLLVRLQVRFENRRDPFLRYVRKLSKGERRERIGTAFAQLPASTQMVFVAHRLDHLSYTEIAERSGIGERDVEREIARTLRAIHDAFWKQYVEDCAVGDND